MSMARGIDTAVTLATCLIPWSFGVMAEIEGVEACFLTRWDQASELSVSL